MTCRSNAFSFRPSFTVGCDVSIHYTLGGVLCSKATKHSIGDAFVWPRDQHACVLYVAFSSFVILTLVKFYDPRHLGSCLWRFWRPTDGILFGLEAEAFRLNASFHTKKKKEKFGDFVFFRIIAIFGLNTFGLSGIHCICNQRRSGSPALRQDFLAKRAI